MKKCILLFVCALSLFSQSLFAQNQPANLYAAGVSANPSASPAIDGSALYAHLVSDGSGTYAFTVLDALPTAGAPLTVTTNIGAGIAQKVATIAGVPFYIPVAAGISFSGPNTGWQWSGGLMGSVKLKGNWKLLPNVRFQKSSVSNNSGYQLIPGILVGWGQ